MEKVLKYLMLLFITTLSLTVTSCGDDEDEPNNPTSKNSVVGVWRHDFSCGYQLLTLEKNGKYFFKEFDNESGNWSESGTYSLKDNIITIESEGEVSVYTILTLTQNKMIMRYEGSYLGQYPNHDEEIEDWTRVE